MEKQENCVENRCFILKYTIWSNYEKYLVMPFYFPLPLTRAGTFNDDNSRGNIFNFRRKKTRFFIESRKIFFRFISG